jgi:chemotaxis protein CheZ
MSAKIAVHDSDDLEALFDSIVAANTAENEPPAEVISEIKASAEDVNLSGGSPDKVINQIGHIARNLHDTLRELGLDKGIEKAASSIPDTRDRLNYVATLTEQAADKVLNATEAAQPLVEKIEVEAQRLSGQWQQLFEKNLDVAQFKNLVLETQVYLNEVPKRTKETNGYLMEIMMAQDFQDLTGQVIKKITALTKEMEQQLLALLVENAPASVKADLNAGLLNGPVINANGRSDVVTSQDQVDDLLGSLGF